MTISTGIGTGFVIDGKVYRGAHGQAGEIWSFDPGLFGGQCGDIINDVASGSGLVKQALAKPQIAELQDAYEILCAAENGNQHAVVLAEQARNTIAATLLFVIHLLDPDLIVLGGGMCAEPERMVNPVIERVRDKLCVRSIEEIPIRRAELWDDAILYGAVELIRQRVTRR